MSRLFTSESVTEGHPDKVADAISDSVLDELLRQDPTSRVAVETLVTTGMVVVAGEVTTEAYADVAQLARDRILEIGYDSPRRASTAVRAACWCRWACSRPTSPRASTMRRRSARKAPSTPSTRRVPVTRA